VYTQLVTVHTVGNCLISFCFRLCLVPHACAIRFDEVRSCSAGENFLVLGTVALSFLFDNYCLIMD